MIAKQFAGKKKQGKIIPKDFEMNNEEDSDNVKIESFDKLNEIPKDKEYSESTMNENSEEETKDEESKSDPQENKARIVFDESPNEKIEETKDEESKSDPQEKLKDKD